MTLGEKIKSIRKRFGLSQEELSEIINVSRQAITKWESDAGLPDTENLVGLSNVFGLTVDYLLNKENDLPLLVMRKELDKNKYKNKISSYESILIEYYPEPWKIYILNRSKKLNKLESFFNIFATGGDYALIEGISDLSPYYLVIKDNLKLLVNIKDWVLEVTELDSKVNDRKFIVGKNIFIKNSELKLRMPHKN
ncbi:MAG: helix-turn-helix transcriptional regulator [Tenericutes bacterium]|nr:helix-turn-helix transcriptional regulator [Mycoplasmatota bacterium]